MHRPDHLPEFENPPLTEVALSVQFQRIELFDFAQIGPLWDRFRARFPHIEYHPPLASTFETFGLPQGFEDVRINFGGVAPLPRCWFVSETGNELIQFQPDRLVHNWRKVADGNVYPHYEDIRSRFREELDLIASFLQDAGLGELLPNQCEVTYVNIVPARNGVRGRVLTILSDRAPSSLGALNEPEDIAVTARFIISDGNSDPAGRLIVQSTPVVDPGGQPATHLQLVGRGAPTAPTVEAALEFMDLARDRIVCGFAEITTDELHSVWKRSK